MMFPVVERPRITEIQVRIDCNGCVQKIKKALHGINGIYDVYIDLQQQKLAIIGWADPEKIIKAIKKARKTATICSHSEMQDPPPPGHPSSPPPPPPDCSGPPPPPQDRGGPPPDQPHPPQPEPPRDQHPPPSEPPRDQPPPQHPPNCEPPHHHQRQPKDVEEVHVIHHPPDYNYGYGPRPNHGPGPGPGYNPQPNYDPRIYGHGYRPEMPQPVQVTRNYHQYRPAAYVTHYEYAPPPPPPRYSSPYGRMDNYSYYNNGDYQNGNRSNNYNNGYDTSVFNEENPNACEIC